MATIKQIASMAGVSRGTVDRVLNNRKGVNPQTEIKIKEIAASLNYTPSKAGRNLAILKKNLKLGFIMFDGRVSNPFFEDVVTGIKTKAEELEDYGIRVDIRYSDIERWEHQIELMEELANRGVKGIAITPINHPMVAQKMRELKQKGIAFVTVNSDINDSGRLAYVGSNYYQSGKTAGGLMSMIMGDHSHIGIISGSENVLCHTERVAGFRRNLEKYHPKMKIVSTVFNHDDDFESFTLTKNMLTEHPEIDGLFLAAAGVYGACRAVLSLEAEKKLKIICYDCVPTTKKLIKSGTISAAIDQQPFYQGSKPLDILFNYLTMDVIPEQEFFYTNIEIKIRENL